MSKKKFSKLFSSFLIFTLLLTVLNPIIVSANIDRAVSDFVGVDESILQMKEMISEQEEILTQIPKLHPELKDLSGDKEVAVIVQLSEPPVALEQGKKAVEGEVFTAAQSASAKNKVESQQDSFEKELSQKKVDYKKEFTYNQTFNGMSMKVKADELETLLEAEGVVSVQPDYEVHALEVVDGDETLEAQMSDSTPHLEVPTLWDMGYEGQGVKVAVLDTGIDYHHPEFEGVYKGGYNFVPHTGNDYARERADDDPYETSPLDRPDHRPEYNSDGGSFSTSHGTHVAGTIAAQGNNSYGITGIAPKIDLYAYRVLGAYGSGATSGIIAAIDKSVEEGMDIINLSLGGADSSQTAPGSIAINNAALAGVTAVVATGNSGPNRGTIGSPASAAFAISVGNSTVPETLLQGEVTVGAGDYSQTSELPMFGWTYGDDPRDSLTGTYEVVAIDGVGNPTDFEGEDVEGKVALISRGVIPFVEKIAAAKEAGAVAAIIHNNIDGEGPSGFFLSTSLEFIPTFDMSTAEGNALREAIAGTDSQTGTVSLGSYTESTTLGDEVNSSSSRGPSTPDFDIKPDVVAPGTNIMSAIPAYERDYPEADYTNAYNRATGTSMATPHVAAIAALLKQKNPDWTPFDIKVAISNTAKQLDTTKFDVFSQGPGLIQPVKAATTNVLAYSLGTTEFQEETYDNIKGTVTFGKVEPDSENERTITREINVKNLVDTQSEFDVVVEVTKNGTGDMAGANVTVDANSFTLTDEHLLTVTLNVPSGEGAAGNEILGYIHLQSDTSQLLLPFAAEFSTEQGPTGVAYYELVDDVISPNGDGKRDDTSLEFGLYNDHPAMIIELWDLANPQGGPYGDGYIGFLASGNISAGAWRLPINGTFYDWIDEALKPIPDGVYTVDFNQYLSGAPELLAWDGPLFVKASQAEVIFDTVEEEIDGTEYELTGTVFDKFVDFGNDINWGMFGLTYDVNDMVTVSYELADVTGAVVDNGTIALQQDGTFAISLINLTPGENQLTLSVDDVGENSTEEIITFNVKEEEEEVVEDFTVTLTPSTTEPTEGPVTISIETDSVVELVELKWLPGEKTVADFAEAGTAIDLATKSFEVSENGAYTVYAKNEQEVEAVQVIVVDNITEAQEPVAVTLTPSTVEPTEGPVTVTVETDSAVELVSMKWLLGDKTVEDFAHTGNNIDLEESSFEVTANGTYTVYVENSLGVQAVQTITVENITEPNQDSFSIDLTASTRELTEGPVTITVDTNTEAELVSIKWLQGEKEVGDFAEAGNEVNLDTKSFEVTENGTYTVYVKNDLEVEEVQTITITNIIDPNLAPVEVTLIPSTTEPTEGPITIKVDTDSKLDLVSLKWLQGEKEVEDFAEAGHVIDLAEKSFEVSENGTYTVYVKNSADVEAVQVIEVDNITEPVVEPELTLIPSTTEPTEGPITITVETDAEVEALKWLAGQLTVSDFAEAGQDIDLETRTFQVTENGTYTVYLKDTLGFEVVQLITISNIKKVEEEVIEEEPVKEDPIKEDPVKETPKQKEPVKEEPKKEEPKNKGSNLKEHDKDKGVSGSDKTLPDTATNIYNVMALGVMLLLTGALAMFVRKRRRA
ncbi:S8 family serine peptidase [Alkalihalobacillus sp. 1P02AB]|uniref:S8 family serine peptidase n=1 Tax=Alkalihalobacillus sp. 1P02AB TaxID=3132260 RepID=UPI0039A55004